MPRLLSLGAALVAGTALSPALADAPRVATDIAPVHSLVARVMDGVGAPDLVMAAGASPHAYSLRPSEAAALQQADLVFWIGEDLTPWMEDAIATLAEGARVMSLLEVEGVTLLEFREGALFDGHDHEGDHDHEETGHDHDHDHDRGHEDHDHGAYDPHAWLSPDNASVWLDAIAAELAAVDPGNAAAYRANAAAARDELAATRVEVEARLGPVTDMRFVVFHDAYQYFERAFEISAAGAISLSDAADPSPARIAEIQERVRDEGISCVLAEPQFNPGLVATVLDGTEAATGVMDPLGAELEPGPGLYPQLLLNLADALAGCR
jgi:zinc transport system substrate-binding protein